MSRALRLGFDATSLLGPRTGVGTMAARVLDGLAKRDGLDVVAYAATWRGRGRLSAVVPAGVNCVSTPMPARPLHLAWRHLGRPSIERFTGPLDVVHGPNFIVPPARHAARVVTVHDLTALHHPEMCTAHTRTYPDSLRRALSAGAWVHTVSEFVRREVLDHFDADPDRVVTVPNGVEHIGPGNAVAGRDLAGGARYLLALGTIEPRKNYPALIEAFDAVADQLDDVRLVIAGPDGWGIERFAAALAATRHGDRVIRLAMVDDRARADLLHGATALVYPSVYEGFGLPPLEAMSIGLPVLATAAGAVREVVDDAALLVEPNDPAALADALVRITGDDELRRELSVKGPARAARYDWSRTVDGLVALYERANVGS